jgi:hypothetical protein
MGELSIPEIARNPSRGECVWAQTNQVMPMRPCVLILTLVMAGCSLIGLEHNDPPPVVPSGEPEGILVVDLRAQADGVPVSVEESIRDHLGGGAPVLVRGALFIDDTYGSAWLCETVTAAGSGPLPSCARPALQLQHPDAGGLQVSEVLEQLIAAGHVGELQEVGALRWIEDATFSGRIIDPLVVSS